MGFVAATFDIMMYQDIGSNIQLNKIAKTLTYTVFFQAGHVKYKTFESAAQE